MNATSNTELPTTLPFPTKFLKADYLPLPMSGCVAQAWPNGTVINNIRPPALTVLSALTSRLMDSMYWHWWASHPCTS